MPAAAETQRTTRLKCSFCGRDESEVQRLIAGPSVYICGSCVALCNEILEEHRDEGAHASEG